MRVELVIRNASSVRRALVDVPNGVLTFGRDPDAGVFLEGQSVSRVHARVAVLTAALRVEDVSTNGTVVGGRIVRRDAVDVSFGAPLQMGENTVWIVPDAHAAPEPSDVPPHSLAEGSGAPAPSAVAPPRAPLASAGGMPAPRSTPTHLLAPAPRTVAVDRAPDVDASPPSAASPPDAERTGPVLAEPTGAAGTDNALRREAHRLLLANLDLVSMEVSAKEDASLRRKVVAALRNVVRALDARIPASVDRAAFIRELADEAVGLGPLEQFLADPQVSEIMVVDPETIFVERRGKLVRSEARFTDDERVRAVVERIVTPLGRRIDESSPVVDARLSDGSRVNAVIAPLALRGTCITIRKFAKTPLALEDLVRFGALDEMMGRFLTRSVIAKKNIVIAGGTGSGKTTLLNVLSQAIPPDERIVTIEDAAELRLSQPHVVSLETRPPNMEGKGEYSIRDLVKNALRMRPDRIIVGECRGGEALDMLQAMNTGHDGSLTTTHANSPREALARLETLVLMAGLDLPVRAIREQIAGAVHVLVQQTRFSDGSRKISQISEVTGVGDDGRLTIVPLFEFVRTGTGAGGEVRGEFRSTGFLPSFVDDFVLMGLVPDGEAYL